MLSQHFQNIQQIPHQETQQNQTIPQQTKPLSSKGGRKKRVANRTTIDVPDTESESKTIRAHSRCTQVEETLLATCYLAIYKDQQVENDQKNDSFWKRVLAMFNGQSHHKRTKDMLTGKWETMNPNCQRLTLSTNV